ncbi:TFIIB-type zinc ribbon-containing protein [Paenibacillus sp. J5C_2022]|uniref:TFIIB-type zinc ribbon-containing protein n=1 Tax=Paenibacillus sp. J5C2022 TaxID=2977129 RepID=UPI0021D3CE0F|nr:TFIIB-type zinc ribbon-containing protein [Paenibacillus sp. J5C2022]MCU6708712.1 TFIIB-type zinc ribbon-containing protein [Paenibacillus sp. J5C2022]
MSVVDYKCPNCGGGMTFDSESGMLSCQSCGRKDDIEQLPNSLKHAVFSGNEAKEYHCSSCGAVIMTEAETTATSCSFCGSSVVLGDRLTGKLAPAMVIPFSISKDEAQKAFKKWCKNGRLTPAGFMTANRIKSITGLYVPFWLYDLHSNIQVQANGTKVRTYTSGDYSYTETQHFDVYRHILADYVKIPVDASEKMNDRLMDMLEPFPYDRLKSFKAPYLAGYIAEKYNYDAEELLPRAEGRIRSYIDSYIQSTMTGYQTVTYRHKDVRTAVRRADYVLLPVWMVQYDYKGEKYTFAMNGQTGKVVGQPPLSKGKMAWWFTGVFFASLLSLKALSWLMGGGFW